jgi:hypothetical protein
MDIEERVASNEATFRALNEEVKAAAEYLGAGPTESVRFVCECGAETCAAAVDVPLDVYERIRSDAHHFLIVPGHVYPQVERTIERTADYAIVEKTGEQARRTAEQEDPRARPRL